MSVYFKPVAAQRSPRAVSQTRKTKIALLGSYSPSLVDAPWDDPSWEFWGHASSHRYYVKTPDFYFDLHPKSRWTAGGKKGAQYPLWLAKNTVPIYMQERFDEVPASIKYPKGRILQEFPRFFTNHAAWMIALALTEPGVTHIGLFGVQYAHDTEYATQRGSAQFWLGYAAGRGIQLVIPEQCSLLKDANGLLYGYESHDENGVLREEYKHRKATADEKRVITPVKPGDQVRLAVPPPHLVQSIADDEEEYPRPAWAKIPNIHVA